MLTLFLWVLRDAGAQTRLVAPQGSWFDAVLEARRPPCACWSGVAPPPSPPARRWSRSGCLVVAPWCRLSRLAPSQSLQQGVAARAAVWTWSDGNATCSLRRSSQEQSKVKIISLRCWRRGACLKSVGVRLYLMALLVRSKFPEARVRAPYIR